MGKISQALNSRPKGSLTSDTVVNPKGGNNMGHAMEVITRSRNGVNAPTLSERRLVDDDQIREEVNPSRENIIDIPEPVVQKAKTPLPKPPPPYPQKLVKQNGKNQFKNFIQIMKRLSINIPLVKDLEQMPGYAKFMKDLVTKKRIGKPRPISMRLQIYDRTMKRPLGVIEDVLIWVDKFILLADFVIIHNVIDYEVPIMLRRTFLAMRKALCDVEAG
ncbi:uncharacterized protein LOC142165174 [Nicotiana tabacum]|uniref:Uncharacterized protein LOC142165174 n=2 Tax=Nicotiana TaxID=4085 RepID=A0AC58S4I5_TOBAC|nr:PREDICTED: uncharacterized protein LOC104233592 [Nicotiana sylvestris]